MTWTITKENTGNNTYSHYLAKPIVFNLTREGFMGSYPCCIKENLELKRKSRLTLFTRMRLTTVSHFSLKSVANTVLDLELMPKESDQILMRIVLVLQDSPIRDFHTTVLVTASNFRNLIHFTPENRGNILSHVYVKSMNMRCLGLILDISSLTQSQNRRT